MLSQAAGPGRLHELENYYTAELSCRNTVVTSRCPAAAVTMTRRADSDSADCVLRVAAAPIQVPSLGHGWPSGRGPPRAGPARGRRLAAAIATAALHHQSLAGVTAR